MQLNCIIVEDEPLAAEKTAAFVARVPYLRLLEVFNDSISAWQYLKTQQPDIVFLDIEMEGMTGIEIISLLQKYPHIIITSAYEKYALKGYELNVTDYLLKPFDFSRFLKAVEKVSQQYQDQPAFARDYFFVHTGYKTQKIFYKDVLYIEGMRDYRCVHTLQDKILTLQTFTEFEQLLPPGKICRIHKSYMVATDKVTHIEKGQVGIKDKILPVSETYKQVFYNAIGFKER
ncbi:LytTR family DNA-binding domain-containing protein [Chitinophaga sp. Cy-1792]|uniref:LytR/AlgR family response regulator transcription factor n=1 Tax=Chitinophaga sp. Cy-1792 TaxID=2608339 RepID=UPI001421E5EE|nr:response regulator transcription factor [Chitinophaga sp. Cy-1792]NIG57520.1 response regulator transcription factor [Chitinophaga sp. Cy-1792]